jgi:hypothetical protein
MTNFKAYTAAAVLFMGTSAFAGTNHLILDGAVSEYSMTPLIERLAEINAVQGKTERTLFSITSPGGSITDGQKLIVKMRYGVEVDTYVPVEAASMGTSLFLTGKKRFAEPDAIFVFHGGHYGGYERTEPMMRGYLQYVTDGTKPTSIELGPDMIKRLDRNIEIKGRTAVKQIIQSMYRNLKVSNKAMVSRVADLMKKPAEYVKKVVFGDFKEDVYFTGKQLHDMGLATHLGSPKDLAKTYAEDRND